MNPKETLDQSTAESIAKNVFALSPLIKKHLNPVNGFLRVEGMTLTHVQILGILGEQKVMTLSELSTVMGIAKSNITPLIDQLNEAQYVERVRDSEDRRIVQIRILPAGQKYHQDALDTLVSSFLKRGSDLNSRKWKQLDRSLDVVISSLSK